jgi:HlyD family secretion protein
MTGKAKFAIAVLALCGAAALAAAGWAYRWFEPHRTSLTLKLSGNIEAHESVLSFKTVQSRIVELPFDEGQWIRRGALIARVDDADYRQKVVIAEATIDVQKRQLDAAAQNTDAARKTMLSDQAELDYRTLDYDRSSKLSAQGFTSADVRDLSAAALKKSQATLERDRALLQAAERNVDLARASVRSAAETLKLAQIEESYTTLVAPLDGVILVRQSELGEVVSPGTPIVTLADIDHVWLRAYVNEPDIGRIRLGQAAVISTDSYPGKHYPGRVSFIAEKAEFTPKSVETHAERVTLVYRVRIDADNPEHELVPGMPADAELRLLPTSPR